MPSDPSPAAAGEPDEAEIASRISESIASLVPHNRALGIRFVECRDNKVTLGLPYHEKLVGNPLTGVIHGGAITTLADATCGTAVFVKLRLPVPIATLDLRIDYLKPARPKEEIFARADCFKVTQNVAFVRCEAFHPGAEQDLVAVANGTFMIFRGKGGGGRGKTL